MVFVNNIFRYSPEEYDIIQRNPPTCSKDWEKYTYNDIKKRIKNFLIDEQNRTCPYCNFRMWRSGSSLHIEHVVPKGKHYVFMFEPYNLAVSCENCNNKKHEKETLLDPTIENYPNSGSDFIIVHPHFDDWEDHLDIENNLFIVGKSEKGLKTIELCKLDRVDIAIDRAYLLNIENQEECKKLILRLTKENDPRLTQQIIDEIRNS